MLRIELATAGQYTATAMAVAVTPLAVMSLPRLLPLLDTQYSIVGILYFCMS